MIIQDLGSDSSLKKIIFRIYYSDKILLKGDYSAMLISSDKYYLHYFEMFSLS